MLNKLKPKSEFSRNVLTLMTGTTIAQAIPIAISPILTRIYTPEDFGVFALYMSIVAILGAIISGRYELAIMLPQEDEDAFQLLYLALIIALFFSIFTLLIVFLFNRQLTSLLGNPEISNWLYLIPVSIFLTALFQNLYYWNNRKKSFKKLAQIKVIQSTTTSSSNLILGFSNFAASGLILSSLLGQVLSTATLLKELCSKKVISSYPLQHHKLLLLAQKYSRFPKFDVLATLSNISAQQLPNIFFNALFNASTAGLYYLTQKTLAVPMGIVATAVSDVFKQRASEVYAVDGNAKGIYITTFKKLFLIGLFPSLFIYFYAVDLFTFIFGTQWTTAGLYVQILIPMLYVRFISSPLSFMLYIGEKQALNLFLNFLFFISIIFSFYLGKSPEDVVKLISILSGGIYIIYIIVSARIAKVF